MDLSAEIVLPYMLYKPTAIWKTLIESHKDIIDPDERGNINGNRIKLSNIMKSIQRRNLQHFGIEFDNIKVEYGHVGNKNLSLVFIEKCIKEIGQSYGWIAPFLDFDSFIQARVYDENYEYWQNAHDPLQYDSAGRSYDHLPMKHNGLPYPLDKMIIDTSQNPGRRTFRDRYLEEVGSVMWFGDKYWEITGKKKEDVLNASWLETRVEASGVVFVKAYDRPFTSSEGEEREIQNKLRALLYPEHED